MKKPAEEISQAPRNNPGKFPEGFVFQLNEQEFENWKSQIVTSNWQRKRCHRDRGAAGPWRKRCHRDRMVAPGASVAIGTGGGHWCKRGDWQRERGHQDKDKRWHRD